MSVVFLILYVDDILLIGYDKESMNDIKDWLSRKFQMKDLGNASYVLGIKIIQDHKKRLLALSQESYIEKVLVRCNMQNSKKGYMPLRLQFIFLRNNVQRHQKRKRT